MYKLDGAVINQTAFYFMVLQSTAAQYMRLSNINEYVTPNINARDVQRRSQAFWSAAFNLRLMSTLSPCKLSFFKMAGRFEHNCKAGFGLNILSNAFVYTRVHF
jgi:hypothetical protein